MKRILFITRRYPPVIGGIETFQNEVIDYAKGDGTPRFNPFFIPKMIVDIAPGQISIKHKFYHYCYLSQ